MGNIREFVGKNYRRKRENARQRAFKCFRRRKKGRRIFAQERLRCLRNKNVERIRLQYVHQNKNGYDTTEVCGKTAECTVSVQTRKFDALENAVSNADKIGTINVNITAPSYLYSKLEDLKLDLLARATANAKERAKTLANAGGASLGNIMSASQGVFQITQPLSTETASYGMYDTSTVEKDVRCVVNVKFLVEK